MNLKVQHYMHLLIGLMLLTLSSCTFAASVNDLKRSGDVDIKAWIGKESDREEQQSYSVNEQIILTIEVATPRWFTGGTRIGTIEIPNVIAKQRNQLATNFTERIDGQTWSKQRWEVTLYPQESGKFVIPPVAVTIQVSTPNGSNIRGNLYTQPLSFSAKLPSGKLSANSPWFAATDVDVKQTWEKSNDDLTVGDSVKRIITIDAKNSLSVLLPELLNDRSPDEYQTYLQPNILKDTQTRGDYRSSRTEQSVYVVQQGGDITFPALTLSWWNSETGTLETIEIEGTTYRVKHTFSSFIKAYLIALGLTTTLGLLILIAGISLYRYYKTNPKPEWLRFYNAVKNGRWGEVRLELYRILRGSNAELELAKVCETSQWKKMSNAVQSEDITGGIAYSARAKIKQGRRNKRTSVIAKAIPQLERFSKPK